MVRAGNGQIGGTSDITLMKLATRGGSPTLLGTVGLALALSAAPMAAQSSVTVHVTGFSSTKGQLMLALHNSRDTFLTRKAPFRAAALAIGGDTVTYTFSDLPAGRYSLAAFHDENANGDLDGVLRIPRERYGFSNNAHGRFGPPSYESTVFAVEAPALAFTVRLRGAIER